MGPVKKKRRKYAHFKMLSPSSPQKENPGGMAPGIREKTLTNLFWEGCWDIESDRD